MTSTRHGGARSLPAHVYLEAMPAHAVDAIGCGRWRRDRRADRRPAPSH